MLQSVKNAFLVALIICSASVGRADTFWHQLGQTFTEAFDAEGLMILGIGTAATVVAFTQDQAVHDAWVNHQRMSSDVSRVGDLWGQGFVEVGVAAGQLVWDTPNGIADVNGLLSSSAVVYALKYSTQRARPDSDTRTSFPSGHTQFSFAMATHLHKAYGLGVAIPAYGMAVFTGLSRLADDAHWFSDVVAGATLGVFFARSSFKAKSLTITPAKWDRESLGLSLTYRF